MVVGQTPKKLDRLTRLRGSRGLVIAQALIRHYFEPVPTGSGKTSRVHRRREPRNSIVIPSAVAPKAVERVLVSIVRVALERRCRTMGKGMGDDEYWFAPDYSIEPRAAVGKLALGADVEPICPARAFVLRKDYSFTDVDDSHSTGGNARLRPSSPSLPWLRPQDRHIAPTCLMSVSLEISFSRTARDAATTGPAQLSQR